MHLISLAQLTVAEVTEVLLSRVALRHELAYLRLVLAEGFVLRVCECVL